MASTGTAAAAKSQQDIYEMFFTQEGYDKSKLSKAEHDVLTESEAEEKKKKEAEKKDEKKETEAAASKKTEPLVIELNNIEDRIDRLTLGSAEILDGLVDGDGETLLYLAKSEKGYELWSLKPRENELKRLWENEAPKPSAREDPLSSDDPAR